MEIYQNNIETLKKYRPDFLRLYEQTISKKEKYPCDEIKTQVAKDGSVILIVQRDGKNVRLNSPYRPKSEAEKWAEQFECDNLNVNAILFGFGNGMFAQALLNRLKEDAKLFICEPNLQIFSQIMHCIDLTSIFADERVFLCFEDINPDDFYDLLSGYTHWTNLETQIYGYHTGYDKLFPEAYRDFLVSIQKADHLVQVNKDTQEYFAQKMVPNMLSNLKYIRESRLITDYIPNIPHDIPAIIVAAGPSLDKNIEELKRAKGKAFILAVDTAMRHLIKHDIMPDAIVTMDPAKPFQYMNDPVIQDIPLFCILEANHEILEFHQGIKIWIRGGSLIGKIFAKYHKDFGPYNPGGSVATAAFSVCVALQFKRVILVGQDLAYEGNITHAGGQVSGVRNEADGIKYIEGIDGKQVKSRHDWLIYLDWFEQSIKSVKDRMEVIDATEGGARIHGTRIMKLRDVINQYCGQKVNFGKILREQSPVFDEEEYQKVREDIQSFVGELHEIIEKAENAAKYCDKSLKLLKRDPENPKMNRLQQEILQDMEEIGKYTIYDIVDIYMSKTADKYLAGVFVVSEDSHKDEINMYLSAKMIFQDLTKSANKLLPLFEKAVAEV